MAHFRAVIHGARGEASRLGHKTTGISTLLQTWGWDVDVSATHNEHTGKDTAHVTLRNHSDGTSVPLLTLNLSADKINELVKDAYRVVAERVCEVNGIATVPHSERQLPVVTEQRKPATPTLGPCSCRRGIERDNCPACEGTGQRIDFAAIRDARKPL